MTRRRSKQIASDKARSQRELSRRMGVSRSTIDRWRRDGLKPDSHGHFDINEAREFQRVRALRAREVTEEGEQRRLDVLDLKEDRLRVDLQLAEYKLLIAKDEYVSRQTVIQEWRRGVVNVKNRFLGLGRELAPLLTGRGPQEVKALIDARVYEILRLLARGDARSNGKHDSEHSGKATNDALGGQA